MKQQKHYVRKVVTLGLIIAFSSSIGLLSNEAFAATQNQVSAMEAINHVSTNDYANHAVVIGLDPSVKPDHVDLMDENGKIIRSDSIKGRKAWYVYPNQKVTLVARPAYGERFVKWNIQKVNPNTYQYESVTLTNNSFVMTNEPVLIKAVFESNSGNKPVSPSLFIDVNETDYFFHPVQWAVREGVTKGTSPTTFSPNKSCTRAQAVTFLWNKAGKPEPVSSNIDFIDVSKNSYYYKAVCWAKEKGITSGQSETLFGSNNICSRSEIITFQWRANGSEIVKTTNNFTDVDENAFYKDAVNWAVKNSITTGTSATTFGPQVDCSRAQIVTFMFNEAGIKR